MATLTKNLSWDANPGYFNSWANGISSALDSLGWVQTADTGQYDPSIIATINNVAQSGTTATLTTAAAHGLSIGDKIGNANLINTTLNGCWLVDTVPSSTPFTIQLASATITSQADAGVVVHLIPVCTITNVAQTTTTATLTYNSGPVPAIADGILVTGLSHTTLNGTWSVASVPGATSLTFTLASATIGSTPDSGIVWMMTPGVTATSSTGLLAYQIWRMDDTLQSTAPVFLKIEFGRSSTGNIPRIAITMGTGSNGSGAINGITTTRLYIGQSTSGASGATTFLSYFSGDVNRLSMCLWPSLGPTSGGAPMGLQIERSHDATGADTGTYVTMMVGYNSSSFFIQSIYPSTGSATTAETTIPTYFPVNTSFNNSLWFFPVFPVVGQMGNPMISGCCKATDVSNLSTPTLNFYGSSHTLIIFKLAPFSSMGAGGCWLMRYE